MVGESSVTQNIIDELHCWDIPGNQKESESGVIQSIIYDIHSSDIQ